MTEPNYNDGKWHGWNGGKCPVHPESVVEFIWPSFLDKEHTFRETRKASGFSWSVGGDARAFLFRVVKEHREPREGWTVGTLFTSAREAKTAYPGKEPIRVREVL